MNPQNNKKVFENPIYIYTSQEAVEDGILFNLNQLATQIKGIDQQNSPFSHITINLLTSLGYMKENRRDEVCGHKFLDTEGKWVNPTMSECPYCYTKANEIAFNFPNLLDLLNQALQIIKQGERGDWFYSGKIETPNGLKQKIFIAQNETSKFTIMLPEDY